MVRVDTATLVSISEVSAKGLSAFIREAEQGRETVFMKNNRPVAALVPMERLAELEEMQDLALVLARAMTDDGARTGLDEVLEKLGQTREELRQDPSYTD